MRRCRFFSFLSGSPLTRYLIHAHTANSRIVFMPHYGVMIQPYTVSIVLIEIIGVVVCTPRTSENVVTLVHLLMLTVKNRVSRIFNDLLSNIFLKSLAIRRNKILTKNTRSNHNLISTTC